MLYKSCEEIESEVLFQLGWDSRVNQADIDVTVRRGVVKLTGSVESYAGKLAAQEAAHCILGVLDVVNEIEVIISDRLRRSDSEIAQTVRQALEWNVFLQAGQISSTVKDGLVMLEGSVNYYREREDAERTASNLPGVRGVVNNITVCSVVEPETVKFLIENALERRVNRVANRIRVKVDNGKVTLAGPVNSWDEKLSVLDAVSHSPGVTAVNDHLFVDFYGISFEPVLAGR
jgi:osmotically-inducible protein OsmY